MFLDDEGTASSSGVSDSEGPKACGVQLVASILSNKKKKAPKGAGVIPCNKPILNIIMG